MTALVVEVSNPFNPLQDLRKNEIDAGDTPIAWLQKRFLSFTEFDEPTICLLNGNPLLRKEWDSYVIKDGDTISFVKLAPGDPITAILVIVAVVAVAAAVFLATNIPKPNAGGLPDQDPVHTLRGQTNRIKLMDPIEVPYGRVRMWPSYAARSYNTFENDDQILFSLFCLGQGSFDIDRIQVEDTLASSFQDVTTAITNPGEQVSLFPDNVVTSVEVANIELFGPNEPEYTSWVGGFVVNPTGTQTNRIEVDITLPFGLYYSNDEGGLDTRTVSAEFEYRAVDDNGDPTGSWILLTTFSKTLATVNAKRYTTGVDVAAGRYEVRGRRTNNSEDSHRVGDTLQWATLRGFLPDTRDYGDVTLLAVKARATNNLNDQASNRFNVIGTRKLAKWNPTTGWSSPVATRSIVWAFCDVFRSAYGGNLADEFLDLPALHELDQFYEGRNEHFDWIFDQKTTVWDAAKTIARVGRAIPMLNGSRITMIRDEPKTLPVAVFNQENIIKDSFRWDIKLFEVGEKDSVEVEYTDPISWNPEEVLCILPESQGLDPEKIKLAGCTDRDHAYHEGMYIAASNYYVRENITFQTGLEGHIPTYGDLISVSLDLPRWGQAGYVLRIDASKCITLSDDVEFGTGTNYIVFRKKDGSAAGPYECVAGNASNVVILVDTIEDPFYFDDIHEPPLYQFGVADQWAKLCKIVDIRPTDGENIEIACTNYDARVHTFDTLDAPPLDSTTPPDVPALPTVTGLRVQQLPDTFKFVTMSWNPALGATAYIVQQSSNGTDWENVDRVTTTSYTLAVVKGYLYLRVAGVNVGAGPWDTWVGEVGVPSGPPNNIVGLQLQQPFTGTFAKIQWESVANASSYKVEVYKDNGATLLRQVFVSGLTYTYSAENAQEDLANTRYLQFQVLATNALGDSDTAAVLNVSNPVPAVVTGIYSEVKIEDANEAVFTVGWNVNPDVDIVGYRVWGSETSGFTPDDATNREYEGTGVTAEITVQKTAYSGGGIMVTPPLYFRVAAYDIWDDEVNYSSEQRIPST